MTMPSTNMTAAGMTNDQPQPQLSAAAATKEPRMLPSEVCAFQMPMIRPRLPLPYQLAMMDTTLGQPVDWNRPARIGGWRGGRGVRGGAGCAVCAAACRGRPRRCLLPPPLLTCTTT
jgi:hypothetical protein